MAILIYYDKHKTPEEDIIEINIWKVEKSKEFPYGIKYRLVYTHKNIRILGYDNERAKGDHKHYLNIEKNYKFVNVNKLLDDFENDVKKIKEMLYGN